MTNEPNQISLLELRDLRAKLGPMDPWKVRKHESLTDSAMTVTMVYEDGNSFARGETDGRSAVWDPDYAACVVATNNAADVLIEIATAALQYVDGKMKRDEFIQILGKVSL